jgi:hypothetical protein
MEVTIFMRKVKRILNCLLSTVFCFTLLSGCSLVRSTGEDVITPFATNDSTQLISGQYYIWHNENETNIVKDVKADQSKYTNYAYKIFTPCISVTPTSDSVGSSYRIVWSNVVSDDDIPTLYEGDALVYYSDTGLLTNINMEHFYDHGYTLGIYGLTETFTGSNIYCLKASNENIGVKGDAYSYFANALYDREETIVLPIVGDIALTNTSISDSGTVKGLRKDSEYTVEAYIGSKRHELTMKADTRIWSSMESFNLTTISYVGDGIMKIDIPDFVESGYYYINGVGFFRYVKGTSYDSNTEFNRRVIVLAADGSVLYDPTTDLAGNGTNNKDALNDSELLNTDYFRVTFSKNKNYLLKLQFSQATVSNPMKPYICYFINDENAFNKDYEGIGTFYNPYIIELTDEEFTNGVYVNMLDGSDFVSSESGDVEYVYFSRNTGAYKNVDFSIEEYKGELDSIEALIVEAIVNNDSENKFAITVSDATLDVETLVGCNLLLFTYQTNSANKNLVIKEQYNDSQNDYQYTEDSVLLDFTDNKHQSMMTSNDGSYVISTPSDSITAQDYKLDVITMSALIDTYTALQDEDFLTKFDITQEDMEKIQAIYESYIADENNRNLRENLNAYKNTATYDETIVQTTLNKFLDFID